MNATKGVGQTDRVLNVTYVPISSLKHPDYNPRQWTPEAHTALKKSIKKHGLVEPLLVNSAPGREGIVIAGNFRLETLRELGYTEVPVVSVDVPDLETEKDMCLRLNKTGGAWDFKMLESFGKNFLFNVGFPTKELDKIFSSSHFPEKVKIPEAFRVVWPIDATMKSGEVWKFGPHLLTVGDGAIEQAEALRAHWEKLSREKAQKIA